MRAFNFDPAAVIALDRILHEPARLCVTACLAQLEEADFVFLQSQTGMTVGNLSSHARKLEAAGYITIHKEFQDNRPRTTLRLTAEGRKAFDGYTAAMRTILAAFTTGNG